MSVAAGAKRHDSTAAYRGHDPKRSKFGNRAVRWCRCSVGFEEMSGGGGPSLTEGRVITRAVEDFRETRGLGEVVVVVVEEEEEEEEEEM